jgi:hypothetical protein
MLLEQSTISFEDEAEVFVSPCGDLFVEQAGVAREIIWLVVRGELACEPEELRRINLKLARALRRQAANKKQILQCGCLVDPDAPF